MRATLVAEQEAGADHGGSRTGLQRLPYAVDVDDPAREQDWNIHHPANLVQQLQRRSRTSDVAAGLDPLRDHTVRTGRSRRFRLVDRATLVNPRGRGKPAGHAPERHNHVSSRGRLDIATTHEGQQQVHRHRPFREAARGRHFGGDRGARPRDRS